MDIQTILADGENQRLLIEVLVGLVLAGLSAYLKYRAGREQEAKRAALTAIEDAGGRLLRRIMIGRLAASDKPLTLAEAVAVVTKAIKKELEFQAIPAIDKDARKLFPKQKKEDRS